MKSLQFEGLMAPVFTPFSNDGKFELNLGVIPEYMRRIQASGIKAILVNGTSGEGVSQTLEERKYVAEAWMQAKSNVFPDCVVVIQVGGASLADACQLASHAEKLGADGIMCLADLFFKPRNESVLADYLLLVSKAAPNTPLLYYHIPPFTGVNLSMSKLMEVCSTDGRVPTFVGLKFTSTDFQELSRCVEICRSKPKLRIFLGCDELMLPALSLGSKSSIATTFNFIPDLSLQMQTTFNEDLNSALQLQRRISAVINAVTRGGEMVEWVPRMKAAMEAITKLPVGPPRPPLNPVSQQHLDDMKRDLAKLLK